MSLHMREDLDRAMAGVTLSPARRAAILDAAQRGERPVKRLVRPVLALAAALAALTLSAFALVPELRAAVAEVLGSFVPYSQTVEGVSVTDQGIEVRVVSALSDATTARVYLAVRDIAGNRLDRGDSSLGFIISRPEAEETAFVSGSRYIGYDTERKTATFEITHEGTLTASNGDTVQLNITRIQPGYHHYRLQLPQVLLTDRLLETQQIDTGETILLPGQTEYRFTDVNTLHLSSMGFASDGRLHILLELGEGVSQCNMLTTLYNKASGAAMDTGEIRVLDITLGDQRYYEISLPATPDILDSLKLNTIYGVVLEDIPAIEGNWALRVKTEQAPQRNLTMNEKIGGITYRGITLSPFALTISGNPASDEKEGFISYDTPVAVLLADGTVLHPKAGGGSYINGAAGDRAFHRWAFEDAVDVTQVTGVAVGYWLIPLDGDTAGPGYWLKELPQ